jgi:trans-aconitate 2-methyltransferase
MPSWDATLYLQFADERTRPAADLVGRIALQEPRRIIDLGCGPGNSTELLFRRWPAAEIAGLDSSPAMIEAARGRHPERRWILADAATWQADEPLDLIFSNAALQWLPDHQRLLPALVGQLTAQGALAVQIPAHTASPLHQAIDQIARQPRWAERLRHARGALTIETPDFYYRALQPHVARVDLWTSEYYHVFESQHMIVEWIRGTGLRPFLDALQPEEQAAFEQELRRAVELAYPLQPDGRVLFPFRRLFLIGYR